MSDLTANVDFALLKEALHGVGRSTSYKVLRGACSMTPCSATPHGSLDQSSFLLRMGIAQRLTQLINNATREERRLQIRHAGKKLVDQAGQGMGRVYRMLGITGAMGSQKQVWPFIPL